MIHVLTFGKDSMIVVEGESCDLNKIHEEWVESKIGPRPVWNGYSSEYREAKVLESEWLTHCDSVLEYDQKRVKLQASDFITYLESLGFKQVPFRQTSHW